MMEVRYKRIDPRATAPTRAHDGDAGFDLVAVDGRYDMEMQCWVYDTGIAFEIPRGHVGLAFARSGNCRTDCYLANGVGVIDSGYRGTVRFMYKDRDKSGHIDQQHPPYSVGERVGQIVIMRLPDTAMVESDTLSDSERGTGGFGSTGR